MTLAKLAVHLGGTLIGNNADCLVTGVAGYDNVGETEVTYVQDPKHLKHAEASPALAIIVPQGITSSSKALLLVDDPRVVFARALQLFDWRRPPLPGIDLQASIAQTAAIHARAHIGAFATVGEGAVIGEGCIISPHAVIGDHVEIGADTVVYPNVTIYPRCTIGKRVVLHSGAVIGADGHGFHPTAQGWEKLPHLGTVIIEDDVEIGANTTVDRATTGATVVGRGSKIDNLVQIAHNVHVGANCMIVSFVGVAGSTVIEDGVIIGGQVGIKDHVRIGAGSMLAARTGITRDIPPGSRLAGYPAIPHRDHLKVTTAMTHLPDLMQTVRKLEQRVAELEGQQE